LSWYQPSADGSPGSGARSSLVVSGKTSPNTSATEGRRRTTADASAGRRGGAGSTGSVTTPSCTEMPAAVVGGNMEQQADEQRTPEMTFMDKAKDLASKVTDKANQVAEDLAEKAGPLAEKAKPLAEKAAPLAEKAGNLAAKGVSAAASSMDKATGGKYHDRIETVTGKLGEALNREGRTNPTEDQDPK
jgi:hypothetical protein